MSATEMKNVSPAQHPTLAVMKVKRIWEICCRPAVDNGLEVGHSDCEQCVQYQDFPGSEMIRLAQFEANEESKWRFCPPCTFCGILHANFRWNCIHLFKQELSFCRLCLSISKLTKYAIPGAIRYCLKSFSSGTRAIFNFSNHGNLHLCSAP